MVISHDQDLAKLEKKLQQKLKELEEMISVESTLANIKNDHSGE